MSLILRQLIGEQRGRKSATADPALKKDLKETKKQLNSILNKWEWGGVKPKTATEFLNKFTPWVDEHIQKGKDLAVFLSKWGSTSLNQLEITWNDTEKDYKERITELEAKGASELSEELKEKLENYENLEIENQRLNRLLNDEESELEKENEKLRQKIETLKEEIDELKEAKPNSLTDEQKDKLAQYDNLETDLDQAKRDKWEAEQDLLATNNRLNNKVKELSEKEKETTQLKKEAQEKDKTQKEKLKELKEELNSSRSSFDKLQEALKKVEEKYRKKTQLLDEEQTAMADLEAKIDRLEAKITELEAQNLKLVKELSEK